MLTITASNVNEAIVQATHMLRAGGVEVSPRGIKTLEYPMPVSTRYLYPSQRVLFCPIRDANPFFHLMEALWILGGRNDVSFPTMFNAQLAKYSDNGSTFHGAYGHRLRSCGKDQLKEVISKLRSDKDTRQAVLQIWDYKKDLNTASNDIPCNDIIFLKIRDNRLNMTVCCRSNDMIWGAYGANAVQFPFIQEYIASMVGCHTGEYTQISDSFHVYPDNPQWGKLKEYYGSNRISPTNLYETSNIEIEPLVTGVISFDTELNWFLDGNWPLAWDNRFFTNVACPMWNAWFEHKDRKDGAKYLTNETNDWHIAGRMWLSRRNDK